MITASGTAAALLAVCAGLLGAPSAGLAQDQKDQPAPPLDTAARAAVIEGVLKRLNDAYVFPDVARKMETAIRERVQRKEYDSITGGATFARRLTADLQEVSHDKHLRVSYSSRPLPVETEGQPSPEERRRYRDFLQSRNFGFQKVELLPGNIGYLALEAFIEPDLAGDTASAAMSFLANTRALIIDLRKNGGGDPAMVALLCSYLFEGESVHLNDLYWRPDNSTQQFWTLPYVPGKRYAGKDVYVLTSKRTFSGAEEFTYNLKNLKRATIIGETTGGGAHPGGQQRINERFAVWVPTGRAINPITKTNWEGTGVTPDVAVSAGQALKTAHLAALKRLLEKGADDPSADELKQAIKAAEKELNASKEKSPPAS